MGNTGIQPVCLFLAIFPCIPCVILVGIRVFRKFQRSTYGIDDTLLLIATLLNIVLSITSSNYIVASYSGYHIWDIPPGAVDFILSMKWNYANQVIYNPILALVKMSFLLTLIKLQSPNKWINRCLWSTLILNGCFAIALPLAGIFQCTPVPRYWDRTIPGTCIDDATWIICSVSFILATDVLILIMPTWILHNLKMPFAKKFQVISFLSIGILVFIVGIYRTYTLVNAFVINGGITGPKDPNADPTYTIEYTLCNIESGLAIMANCGPTIKYLLGFIIPSLKAQDEPTTRGGRSYMYPRTGDSQGLGYVKSTKGNDTFIDVDEVELTNRGRGRDTMNGEITKTVAWETSVEMEGSQQDSNSTCEQKISTPRNVL